MQNVSRQDSRSKIDPLRPLLLSLELTSAKPSGNKWQQTTHVQPCGNMLKLECSKCSNVGLSPVDPCRSHIQRACTTKGIPASAARNHTQYFSSRRSPTSSLMRCWAGKGRCRKETKTKSCTVSYHFLPFLTHLSHLSHL